MAKPKKLRGDLWRVMTGVSMDNPWHCRFYVPAASAMEAAATVQAFIAGGADHPDHLVLEVEQISAEAVLLPVKKR